MYDKITKSSFDILTHLNAKSKEKIEDTFKKIHIKQSVPKEQKEKPKRKIIKGKYDKVTYDDFLEVNKIHTEYILSLKQGNFLAMLYKAELTGALLKFKCKNEIKEGIVVEERENTFLIIHKNNSIKVYPKALYNFIMLIDGVKYFFLGKNLKSNRFFKK